MKRRSNSRRSCESSPRMRWPGNFLPRFGRIYPSVRSKAPGPDQGPKNPQVLQSGRFESGGKSRNRTGDTRIFSPLLYQLSYLAKRRWVAGITVLSIGVTSNFECGARLRFRLFPVKRLLDFTFNRTAIPAGQDPRQFKLYELRQTRELREIIDRRHDSREIKPVFLGESPGLVRLPDVDCVA